MTEENKENCNFQQNYNVFGLDDKPCCYLYHKYCDEIDNCYFKRCKRLEQERDELKKTIENQKLEYEEAQCDINTLVADNSVLYKQIGELKRACEKCKLFDIEKTNRDLLERIDKLQQENKELKELKCKFKEYCTCDTERYRSALEKIKDLCIHYKNTNDKCIINCYAHFIVTDLIQDKINEVLGNESN